MISTISGFVFLFIRKENPTTRRHTSIVLEGTLSSFIISLFYLRL